LVTVIVYLHNAGTRLNGVVVFDVVVFVVVDADTIPGSIPAIAVATPITSVKPIIIVED
jgi:hypothetical protein